MQSTGSLNRWSPPFSARRAALSSVIVIFLSLMLTMGSSVFAQSYQGGLRGAVSDASGGGSLVPGVEITLTNEETGAARSTVSNEEGEYAFTNVLPGNYTLSAVKSGYKKFIGKGIRIGTQEFFTLDIALEIGQVIEEVTVTERAPVLENSNPSVGSTLERQLIENVPTPSRNVFTISAATPTVVLSGDPAFVRQQDQNNIARVSMGGGLRSANNYTLDGVPIADIRNRPIFVPNIESVQEVRVQVSAYDAEMGRTGGGVFNATARSGGNEWHGSVYFQNRPQFAQSNFFFNRQAGSPKPENYYYLFGGSFGGPIIKERTFFWATSEGYKSKSARNAELILPTERELSGDFSQSGVTIYDPLTTRRDPNNPALFIRDPFPNNVIPAGRINPVARETAKFFPKPTNGNRLTSTANPVDRAAQATIKIEHRFTDRYTLTGLYAWYDSFEPEPELYGGTPADPGNGKFLRTVNMVALNNVFAVNNDTVLAIRYGYSHFVDNTGVGEFDPATLGFSQNFLSQIPFNKFPVIRIDGFRTAGFQQTFGDRELIDQTYYSHNANASLTKLIGSHTLKSGIDYRLLGLRLFSRGQSSGNFGFDRGFTRGPNPLTGQANTGSALASFLLGYPSEGSITNGTPNDFFLHYWGGYVQDDWRVTPKLTLNLGLRYEYETGLKERNNHFTVGFARDRQFPVQVPGLNLRGGLLYAGVEGAPDFQNDPSKTRFQPRVGFAYSVTPQLVLRGGYGLFFAPHQYPFPSETRFGTRGYTAVTSYVSSTDGGLTPCATCTLTNPFPNSIQQPSGSSQGLLTGAGGAIDFVDQNRKSAYLHKFSFDVQYELPGGAVASAGYLGSRARNVIVGGINSNTVNINQLDPQYLSLGTQLLTQVPNPFFGNAAFGAFSRQPTISRGQLLRPYPQFTDVLAHQVSAGRADYDALILKLEKRLTRGWAANINYTYSVNKDNVFGEVNFFSNNNNALARALNNYDLDAEYAHSIMDTPHRFNIISIYELPFGEGRHWLNKGGLTNILLGGWSVSVIATYHSGVPSVIVQNNVNSGLLGSFQRPNIVNGVDPGTQGSSEDRLNGWFNPAAWREAPAFTFGNAPRTDERVRTPFKQNWDIAFQKSQRLSEKLNLQLRMEFINLFDEPNFLAPAMQFGRADFGQINQVGGFPRLMQFMTRLQW